MKKILFISIFLSINLVAFSQWTKKSNTPGTAKNHNVTFTIDGIGYAFTGFNTNGRFIYNSGSKYNPDTDTWTTLNVFPGGARGFA